MSTILAVIGSARPGRVAEKVLDYITSDIETRDGIDLVIADLKQINLPFFDNELAPVQPGYTITNPQAIAWRELVKNADSVVFITPEYNHTLSAIQKNALDTLGAEWEAKPVTAVAYGWTGGSLAVETLREVLGNLKADTKHDIAQLGFMKDLNPDGTLLDAQNVTAQIKAAIDEIV